MDPLGEFDGLVPLHWAFVPGADIAPCPGEGWGGQARKDAWKRRHNGCLHQDNVEQLVEQLEQLEQLVEPRVPGETLNPKKPCREEFQEFHGSVIPCHPSVHTCFCKWYGRGIQVGSAVYAAVLLNSLPVYFT